MLVWLFFKNSDFLICTLGFWLRPDSIHLCCGHLSSVNCPSDSLLIMSAVFLYIECPSASFFLIFCLFLSPGVLCHLFIWMFWVLVAAHGILVASFRAFCVAPQALWLQGAGSVAAAQELQSTLAPVALTHGLGSGGALARLLCSMWGLSSPARDVTHLPCIAR